MQPTFGKGRRRRRAWVGRRLTGVLFASVACAALVALLTAPTSAHAFGWTQPRGGHYLRVWNRLNIGNRGIFADGQLRPLGAVFVDTQANYYLEYGLTDQLTLVGFGAPLGFATMGDESTVYTGPLSGGLRWGFAAGDWRFAAEAHYGYAPSLGARAIGAGVAEGRVWTYAPAAETHRGELEVQFGRGVGSRGWITGNVGGRVFSAADFGPALYGSVQFGWAFLSGFTVSATVQAHQPLVAVTATNVSGVSATRYVGFAVDVSYWLNPHWALNAGFGGAFAAQANAAAAPIVIGFEHR